jgi:hypothetical protein
MAMADAGWNAAYSPWPGPAYTVVTDGLKAQAIAEAAARSLTTGKSETITY